MIGGHWRAFARRVEVVVVAGLMLVAVACAITGAFARPSQVPIVAAGKHFVCTVTQVWDGDGPIWCAEGPRIRLARINARELDGSCRPGAPCVDKSGVAARDHLVALLGGARGVGPYGHILVAPVPISCLSDGWGKGERTAAWCKLAGHDLSEMMVRDGYAARWTHPHPSRD